MVERWNNVFKDGKLEEWNSEKMMKKILK